jgi:DNA polymerase-3 subunit delta'
MDIKGMAPEPAGILAHMAGGSYGRAMDMAGGDWLAYRHWLLETVDALPQMTWGARLALAETMARQKDRIETGLALLQSYLRDVIVHRFAPEKVINRDLGARIAGVAAQNRLERLMDQFEAVEQAWRDVAANANLRLSLEAMVLRLAGP